MDHVSILLLLWLLKVCPYWILHSEPIFRLISTDHAAVKMAHSITDDSEGDILGDPQDIGHTEGEFASAFSSTGQLDKPVQRFMHDAHFAAKTPGIVS